MARPKKPIDVENLKKLAERGWETKEIAAFFNVSSDTIERRYAALVTECRHSGKAKLRDVLWQRALGSKAANDKGSDRVLIHLADRLLGPVKQEIEQKHEGKIEVEITDYRSKKE